MVSPSGAADHTIRKIVIMRALFLGDLLCSTPALRLLRRSFPEAEITLIGLPWAESLVHRFRRLRPDGERPLIDRFVGFAGFPGIQEVPYDPGRADAFLEEARSYGYDLAIQMHGNGGVSNGFVANLGAPTTLGYQTATDTRLSFSLPYDPDQHEVLRWMNLVEAYLLHLKGQSTAGTVGDPSTAELEFPLFPTELRRATALVYALADGSGPLIGLHTGAKDPARRWPHEQFAALADLLGRQYNARIVLTGNNDERQITAAIRRMTSYPVLDLAGSTDLGALAAIIKRLDLLVTNDTGVSHLAAALETPSVVLFGPARPHQWAPLNGVRHRVIDALDYDDSGADPQVALHNLPVEAVFQECEKLLVKYAQVQFHGGHMFGSRAVGA